MKINELEIPGLLLIEPKVFGDERGYFLETWNRERYAEAGFQREFVQDNLSSSRRGVLRGLHYQWPHPQGKLVSVVEGEVFDVAVDIRVGSPTFGQWKAVLLTGRDKQQFFVPEGFAHGFVVVSDLAVFTYKCTAPYRPQFESSIAWNDPDIAIDWPTTSPLLSPKDLAGIQLRDISKDKLPVYRP